MFLLNTAPAQVLGTVFAGAGVLHFVRPEPFDTIVPPQLPGSARTYTYASGAAELVTAGLIAIPATRALGRTAAVALLLAVWPGNIYMAWLWRNESWIKRLIACARVPFQLTLIRAARNIGR